MIKTNGRPIKKSPVITGIIAVLSSKGWEYPKDLLSIVRIEIHKIIN
ncbi:hypothetical protein LD85_1834 [Saccharolobus islandicus L.D.8.5]|uniref:Uncharacterized protein n=1 Tax=Saccharolobus islandicus (strain L.D.8.5 / Lassen \|nr:hypothetical protein LD85_1834 [Sulfolobus islandicus L.D.8.5]